MRELELLLKRLIEFGLLTDSEEETVYRELLNLEMQLLPKTAYIEFIEAFNHITGKKYKPDIDSRNLYYENDTIFTNADRLTALKNCLTDPWVKENSGVVSPKWILKSDNLAKYSKYEAPKNNSKSTGKGKNVNESDYNNVAI